MPLQSFPGKDWKDSPDATTPLTAAALEDTEGRLANWFAGAVLIGTGTPEGVVTAGGGTAYLRKDGGPTTAFYVKTSGAGNTGWVAYEQPKRELAHQELTTDVTGIGAATADVTGLSITFVATQAIIMLEAFLPNIQQVGGAAGIGFGYMTDNANAEVCRLGTETLGANVFGGPWGGKRRLTGLTIGNSYTYKARASVTSGTLSVFAHATRPSFLRAYEV